MSFTRPNTKNDSIRHRKRSDGFTLIELLVAITIFSLVIGMGMFTLRFAFGIFRHLDAPFAEETRRIARVRDSIHSTFLYITEKQDIFGQKREFYTYFTGEPERMTFITARSQIGPGLTISRISRRDRKVVLEEAPLYSAANNYLLPTLDVKEKQETTIFTDTTAFRLEYFAGDKKLSELKDDIPTMVRMAVTTESGEKEYTFLLPSDYTEKKTQMKNAYEHI